MIGLNRYAMRGTGQSVRLGFQMKRWGTADKACRLWISDISSSCTVASSSSSSSNNGKQLPVQEDFLTKYFSSQMSIDSDSTATTLSPAILDSMLRESLQTDDLKTTNMLISQAVSLGSNGISTIEKVLQYCLQKLDFVQAARILQRCDPKSHAVSNTLCNDLLAASLSHYHWDSAFIFTAYMLLHNMRMSERAVFFVTGGLLTDVHGVVKVLELMRLIIELQREDLAKMFSFSKMNQFALSLGGNKALRKQNIEAPLSTVMATWLAACEQHDFASFSLAKMITSIARAAKLQDLAATFAKDALQVIAKKPRPLYSLDDKDALSLLRGLSQGDGVVERWYTHDANHEKQLSAVLLQASFDHCYDCAVGKEGIMKSVDFFTNYWVLAYRLRGHLAAAPQFPISIDNINNTEEDIAKAHQALSMFIQDNKKNFLEIKTKSGSYRRIVRLLCDELGLKHKESSVATHHHKQDITLHINKTLHAIERPIPSIDSLMQQDNSIIQHESKPLLWKQARAALLQLSDAHLLVVVHKLATAMKQYPSTSWLLLLAELLAERDLPLPQGFLRSALRMSSSNHDLYGMIEVLQLAYSEKERVKNVEFQRRLEGLKQREKAMRWSAVSLETSADVEKIQRIMGSIDPTLAASNTTPQIAADMLSVSDWNQACDVAYVSRNQVSSFQAFQEIFMEIIALRRKYGVEIDRYASALIVKFLAQSMMNPDLLKALLIRLHKESSPQEISHVECLAISRLLIHLSGNSKLIQCSFPLFRNENYLNSFSSNVENVASRFMEDWCGEDEGLVGFEKVWSQQHTIAGRKELFSFVKSLVEDLHDSNDERLRDAEMVQTLTDMTVHVAYLVACFDKEHSVAFQLLMSVLPFYPNKSKSK